MDKNRFRGFSFTRRAARARREEEELLLPPDEEHLDDTYHVTDNGQCPPNPHADLPVYATIHRIRRDVIATIDDPYTLEQLAAPRANLSIVRPLVDHLYEHPDVSLVYCLLVNRIRFLHEQAFQGHRQSVNISRAMLCELVASKILRRFDEDNPGRKGLLLLANILVAGFQPFQNAPDEIVQANSHALHWAQQKKEGYERKLTALELGIISQSKLLLSTSACQRVVEAIYKGQVVYTPSSFLDLLPDPYKYRPISLYEPRKSRLLNQYRLIVPRTRNLIEVGQFIILMTLYVLVMVNQDPSTFTIPEILFCVYASGWGLDQFASILEHGWTVYTQNLWSFLDVVFAIIFVLYLGFRIRGLSTGDLLTGQLALQILAMGAPVLIPRLGFVCFSENLLFLSLRTMMANFSILTILAVWCFAGFLLAMRWLSHGVHGTVTISKWMLWVWFGLDGTGIGRSAEFHWLLGPTLMISFAFLGNTLFLTILVAMLSNSFANIVANASAEIQFRRAVLTFEGVKSDAIFAYQPPFNMLALVVMLPLKVFLTARWFHKVNVAAVRVLNAPLLLIIALYERRFLWAVPRHRIHDRRLRSGPAKKRRQRSLWDLSTFSVHGDIEAVFEDEPPHYILGEPSPTVDFRNTLFDFAFPAGQSKSRQGSAVSSHQVFRNWKPRKESVDPFALFADQLPEMVHEAGGGDKETKKRLRALESSTRRIEDLLRKMCDDSKSNTTECGSEKPTTPKTPTYVLKDIDKIDEEDEEDLSP